jgi:hypothetical protein
MTDGNPQITNLRLNDLCQNKPERPGWSLIFGATCADAASVCLDDRGHPACVALQIDGIQSCEIELQWNAIDDTIRRFNADQEVATEYGAYGIAALTSRSSNVRLKEKALALIFGLAPLTM